MMSPSFFFCFSIWINVFFVLFPFLGGLSSGKVAPSSLFQWRGVVGGHGHSVWRSFLIEDI